MTPLTDEQLNAPLCKPIINPRMRFPSETIFRSPAAEEWYRSQEEEKEKQGGETKAEQRRRKKQERREANEERYRRWREEALARERVVEPAHADPRIEIAHALMPIIAPKFPWPLSEEAQVDTFWQVIADFGWHNKGMGPNPTKRTRDIITTWPDDYRRTFQGWFTRFSQQMLQSLRDDIGNGVDIFQRNDIYDDNDAKAIAQHFVALGREAYNNLLGDHETAQLLIMLGEWDRFPTIA